jgi:hypothetical protein
MNEQPKNTAWFSLLFGAYSVWLAKRNFHSVRVWGDPQLKQFDGRPLVIYANHPSWWDPIVGSIIRHRLLRNRISFAPIDAAMLEKYAFFKKLGYFGVDKQSVGGVRSFLKNSGTVLSRRDTLMFITPQGRFADVRETSPTFESGLSHLASRHPDVVFLPMALEFTYWEEKKAEILIRFGKATRPVPQQKAAALNTLLEDRLAAALQDLAASSIARDVHGFQNLLDGSVGTNLIYDSWRWMKSSLTGKSFTAAHGTK